MSGWGELSVGVIVAVLAALALLLWLRGRNGDDISSLRQDLQTQLSGFRQAFTQELGEIRGALQRGVTDAGLLASQAQQAMSGELSKINQQLGQFQEAGRQLSQASQALQQVLGGAKTRGILGEAALERMLEDALPRSAYETQYRFSTGAVVDAILRAGDRVVPVDSKFPLESYRRMCEAGDAAKDEARKEFARAIRNHADSIAEKYILPGEGTLEYAFMFIPSEGVYYEFLVAEDPRTGPLTEYCRSKRVIAVSPNVLYAYLHTILMGLRGMQIEENARRLLTSLDGLKKQLSVFAEVYDKIGTHLRNAQQCYSDADTKLERTRGALDQLVQGTPLLDPSANVLEGATKD